MVRVVGRWVGVVGKRFGWKRFNSYRFCWVGCGEVVLGGEVIWLDVDFNIIMGAVVFGE